MRNFQEQMEIDVDAVWFNKEAYEFVSPHMIGGIIRGKPSVELDVVADRELYQERKVKDNVENISLDGLVVFIKKTVWHDTFGKAKPKVDNALKFDGADYQIESVDDDMYVYAITIGGARG